MASPLQLPLFVVHKSSGGGRSGIKPDHSGRVGQPPHPLKPVDGLVIPCHLAGSLGGLLGPDLFKQLGVETLQGLGDGRLDDRTGIGRLLGSLGLFVCLRKKTSEQCSLPDLILELFINPPACCWIWRRGHRRASGWCWRSRWPSPRPPWPWSAFQRGVWPADRWCLSRDRSPSQSRDATWWY